MWYLQKLTLISTLPSLFASPLDSAPWLPLAPPLFFIFFLSRLCIFCSMTREWLIASGALQSDSVETSDSSESCVTSRVPSKFRWGVGGGGGGGTSGVWGAVADFDFERENGMGGGGGGRGIPVESVSVVLATANVEDMAWSFSEMTIKFQSRSDYYLNGIYSVIQVSIHVHVHVYGLVRKASKHTLIHTDDKAVRATYCIIPHSLVHS